ncbi:rho guanine nucleotide exchange factor 38-like [Brevipalpus obovatus]|uniref:rho guanine nucleotide exchange factor 38-like n=1 Tax=Brevipalpus obovatus TaxID=246614 RepID=UPI003D9DC946
MMHSNHNSNGDANHCHQTSSSSSSSSHVTQRFSYGDQNPPSYGDCADGDHQNSFYPNIGSGAACNNNYPQPSASNSTLTIGGHQSSVNVSNHDFTADFSDWGDTSGSVNINPNSSISYDRSQARKNKQMEQRSTIITEMLQSERDYCADLKSCAKAFIRDNWVKHQLMNKGVDVAAIFRNLEEIISVSEKLTTSLEEKNLCRRAENQMIGCCFVEIFDELRKAYLFYCRDHEGVLVAWRKAEQIPEARTILDEGLNQIKRETNCFDVPSLLIKPVQRILKYPLLLNELSKCTEESHPDREQTIKAANMIANLASEINEKKRQKDLVVKYKKDDHDQSFSSRISKINFHSMKKKSSRLQNRITSMVGFSKVQKDDKFEEEYEKFKTIEKTIKNFLKNLGLFMQSFQEFVDACFQFSEDVAAFYAERCKQKEVEEFRTSHRLLKADFFEEFKQSVQSRILSILQQLLTKFTNPAKLAQKRADKLLDYEAAIRRMESNKDQSRFRALKEEENIAKHNYEALNTQLLAELPVFSSTAVDILYNCIGAFMRIKRSFIAKVTTEVMKLLELSVFLGSSAINSYSVIVETFQVKYNLIVDQMCKEFSLIPGNLFPDAASGAAGIGAVANVMSSLDRRRSTRDSIGSFTEGLLKKNSHMSQNESHRSSIRNAYPGKIYRVKQDYESTEVASIHVCRGDIVGVIKFKDPLGNPHLWFVDNGYEHGIIPETFLTPVEGTSYSSDSTIFPQVMYENLSERKSESIPTRPSEQRPIARTAPSVPELNQSQHPHESTSDMNNRSDDSSIAPPLPPRSSSVAYSNDDGRYYTAPDEPDASRYYLPPTYDEVTAEESTISRQLHQNLLIFDELQQRQTDSTNECPLYVNLDEFDPLASSSPINTSSANNSSRDQTTGSLDDSESDSRPLILINYQALFPFTAQGPHQLSLSKGEVVLVKYNCDSNGNNEWWFVRNKENQEGYAPANYLGPLE